MVRHVFVSYRFGDSSVRQFRNKTWGETTVRDYVNVLVKRLEDTDLYEYNGDEDGEDLSGLDDETIESILRDKMFYTSITIVLISPRMFKNIRERDQWIPWEIPYSLKNKSRKGGDSNMNAVLVVVLPDQSGSYDYAVYPVRHGMYVKRRAFFRIIQKNMFNRKGYTTFYDRNNNPKYVPGNSYIALVRWCDFLSNPEYYLGLALKNRGEWDKFDIVKTIGEGWIS